MLTVWQVMHSTPAAVSAMDKRNSYKLARMCAMVVTIFAMAWTPFEFYLVFTKFVGTNTMNVFSILFAIGQCKLVHQPDHLRLHVETDEDCFRPGLNNNITNTTFIFVILFYLKHIDKRTQVTTKCTGQT